MLQCENQLSSSKLFIYGVLYLWKMQRRGLWYDLLPFGVNSNKPWAVGWDFNVVTRNEERIGCSTNKTMEEFVEFNNYVCLLDAGFYRSKYA